LTKSSSFQARSHGDVFGTFLLRAGQHFLQLRKLSRAARKAFADRMLCRPGFEQVCTTLNHETTRKYFYTGCIQHCHLYISQNWRNAI